MGHLKQSLSRAAFPPRQLVLGFQDRRQGLRPHAQLRLRLERASVTERVAPPERRTLRTVSRAIFSSQAIRLIPLPF